MAQEGLASTTGPLMQLAFVPDDFDAALAYWTRTMGVGPFFHIDRAPVENVMFDGAPSEVEFGLAIAYWGEIQIELVKQHNDAPSIFNTPPWFQPGGALNHTCVLTDDMAETEAAMAARGGLTIMRLDVVGGGEAIYADMGGGEGLVEVYKPGPRAFELFDLIRAASENWDGSDPVRLVG